MYLAPHRTADAVPERSVRTDVAIVGSGAAGAPAAAALSAAGLRVLVLEEGWAWRPGEMPSDPAYAARHLYAEHGARLMRGTSAIPLAGGRALGGSTVVNSAICYRAPAHILRSWCDGLGLAIFEPHEMAATYDLVEKTIGVTPTPPDRAGRNNLIVKRGAESLGLAGEFIPRNAPDCVGSGVCQLGCPVGAKGSVDRNFLPAAARAGADIWTGARVVRIRHTRRRVEGVDVVVLDERSERPLRRIEVHADHIVLAAGAIATPMLLMRSGLAHSDHVGRHLHVHPCTSTVAMFDEEVRGWDGVFQGYCVTALQSESILLQTYFASPEVFYALAGEVGDEGQRFLSRLSHLASCGVLVGEQASEGQVRPGARGGAEISYRLADGDRVRLLRGLRAICAIFEAAGSREIYPGLAGTPPVRNAAEAARALPDATPAQRMYLYASHPMGTSRMGRNSQTSALDPHGSPWGVEGLTVLDASIFPTALSINPQLTVMAAALRLAWRLAERMGHAGGAVGHHAAAAELRASVPAPALVQGSDGRGGVHAAPLSRGRSERDVSECSSHDAVERASHTAPPGATRQHARNDPA
jgi:choline dehydrogenase-like flavoprotein